MKWDIRWDSSTTIPEYGESLVGDGLSAAVRDSGADGVPDLSDAYAEGNRRVGQGFDCVWVQDFAAGTDEAAALTNFK